MVSGQSRPRFIGLRKKSIIANGNFDIEPSASDTREKDRIRARGFFFESDRLERRRTEKNIGEKKFDGVRITAMGLLGHIYFSESHPGMDKEKIAEALAKEARIPLVLYESNGRVFAVNRQGRFEPEKSAREILGGDHPAGPASGATLKVATYNIHSCIDTSKVLDMEKIAAVVSDLDPDVPALQEVDAFKSRTANEFQAKWLEESLGMGYFYYPVVRNGVEKYGIAVLSKIPMEKIKFGRLPAPLPKRNLEIRGAMWVRVEAGGTPVNLINTHLGLFARERRLQIRDFLAPTASDYLPVAAELALREVD